MYDLTNKRILVTGAAGFLGSHVVDALRVRGCVHVDAVGHARGDLTSEVDVKRLLLTLRPQVVIQMAGLVGGIGVNERRPADFLYTNLMIDTLMLHWSQKLGVERFAAAAAGCGYPLSAPTPLREEDFWNGYPQGWSAPYSLAKRMLDIHSRALFAQYGFQSVVVIPGNIYGTGDQFNLEDAHVIPALVRKFVEAADDGLDEVVVWGTGKATRDFVYASDVAEGLLRAIERYDTPQIVNVSSGVESEIKEVVAMLASITGFAGKVAWDASRADGQLRRCFDISRAARELDFVPKWSLRDGLCATVAWYRRHRNDSGVRK